MSELYWAGSINANDFFKVGQTIRQTNWKLQDETKNDFIPSNDFLFYNQVLDLSLAVRAIPKRYQIICQNCL